LIIGHNGLADIVPHGRGLAGIVNHIVPVLASSSTFLGPQAAASDFRGLAPSTHHIDLRRYNLGIYTEIKYTGWYGGISIKTRQGIKPGLLPGISSRAVKNGGGHRFMAQSGQKGKAMAKAKGYLDGCIVEII